MKINCSFLLFMLIMVSAAQPIDPNVLRALVAYNVPQQRDYADQVNGGYKPELYSANHPGVRGMGGLLSQGGHPYGRQYVPFPAQQIRYGRDHIPVGHSSNYPEERPSYAQSNSNYNQPATRTPQLSPVNRYDPYPSRQGYVPEQRGQAPYRPGIIDLRPFGGLRGLLRLGLPDNVYH